MVLKQKFPQWKFWTQGENVESKRSRKTERNGGGLRKEAWPVRPVGYGRHGSVGGSTRQLLLADGTIAINVTTMPPFILRDVYLTSFDTTNTTCHKKVLQKHGEK